VQHSLSVIVRGIDGEVRIDANMYAVLAKYLSAKAVEGSYVCPLFETWGKGGDPAPHFVGRLVREGEGKQAKVLPSRIFEQRRDAAGEDLRFA
jgi:hypothetical protein